jgi:hypothetical protein
MDMEKKSFENKLVNQFGCSDQDYQQLKKETMEDMEAHPLKFKLKLYFTILLFVVAIVLMIVAAKYGG